MGWGGESKGRAAVACCCAVPWRRHTMLPGSRPSRSPSRPAQGCPVLQRVTRTPRKAGSRTCSEFCSGVPVTAQRRSALRAWQALAAWVLGFLMAWAAAAGDARRLGMVVADHRCGALARTVLDMAGRSAAGMGDRVGTCTPTRNTQVACIHVNAQADGLTLIEHHAQPVHLQRAASRCGERWRHAQGSLPAGVTPAMSLPQRQRTPCVSATPQAPPFGPLALHTPFFKLLS